MNRSAKVVDSWRGVLPGLLLCGACVLSVPGKSSAGSGLEVSVSVGGATISDAGLLTDRAYAGDFSIAGLIDPMPGSRIGVQLRISHVEFVSGGGELIYRGGALVEPGAASKSTWLVAPLLRWKVWEWADRHSHLDLRAGLGYQRNTATAYGDVNVDSGVHLAPSFGKSNTVVPVIGGGVVLAISAATWIQLDAEKSIIAEMTHSAESVAYFLVGIGHRFE